MEITTFRIEYEGGEANQNRLIAYDGTKSLEGFSWALTVVLNYAVTGNIRKQGDASSAVQIFLLPSKKGSFIVEVAVFLTQPNSPFLSSILGTVTVSAVTTLMGALIVKTFNAAVGRPSDEKIKGASYIRRMPAGDIDDLVVRIEPPLTRAHAAIGRSASSVRLLTKKTELAKFDSSTKAYLESDVEPDAVVLQTNVSAFNAVSNNGRLYDLELARTVPFTVKKPPFPGTKAVLSESLRNYTRGWPSDIRITARREISGDRRLKRYHISAAEPLPQGDN